MDDTVESCTEEDAYKECKSVCPWCLKGEVYAEAGMTGRITVRCSKCKHCFHVYLADGRTEKAKAHRSPVGDRGKNKLS